MDNKTEKDRIKELNIYQKLLEVKSEVQFIKKESSVTNKGKVMYKFAGSLEVLSAVNPLLIRYGLYLQTEIIGSKTNVGMVANKWGEAQQFVTELDLRFTWINSDKPDEKITSTWYQVGIDNADKSTGKALTYAERYFLLKSFNIPTPEDDLERYDPDQYISDSDKQLLERTEKAIKWIGSSNDLAEFQIRKDKTLDKIPELKTDLHFQTELSEIRKKF